MRICVLIFKILVVPRLVLATKNSQIIIDQDELFTPVLIKIILEFYVKLSNTIFVSKCSIVGLDEKHSTILGNTFAALGSIISVSWIIDDQDYSNRTINRVNNIILIDSYQSFRLISKNITSKSFEYFGYYTIVLTQLYGNHSAISNQILQNCWENDIINVHIIAAAPGTVLLYTYFPFTPSKCGKVVPVIWNYFKRGHFVYRNKELFPPKTKNLSQCTLSVLVCPDAPYVYIKRSYPNNTYDLEGLEYKLIQTLSERMNFKPVFQIHFDPNIGMAYDNGTVTQALGMIFEKQVNLSVGAYIETPELKSILTASTSYSYDEVVLVLPNPSSYSSFEKLFFPFTFDAWILILIMITVAVIFIKTLEKSNRVFYEFVVGTNSTYPYLNIMNVLLTGGTLNKPRKSFARFLLIIWATASLILQTVYQGELFKFIKMNKTKMSVQNFDELIERNISIKLIKENYYCFLHFDERMENLLIFVDSNSTYQYVTDNEAYITLEMELVYSTQRKSFECNIFEQPKTLKLGGYSHIIYLPKHSYLKQSLDEQITRMNENGLTELWSVPYKKSTFNRNNNKIPRKLNISQLLGIIEVCLGLFVVALITLILEILSTHCLTVKTCLFQ